MPPSVWKSRFTAAPSASEFAILAVILAGGAFSFYQAGSGTFYCGNQAAGDEIRYWLALSAMQGLLFLAGGLSARARGAYRLLQYLLLPVLGFVLAQLAMAYPRVFVCMGLFGAAYWMAIAIPALVVSRRLPAPPDGLGAAIAETAVFLLATLVIHSTIAFVFLHLPGRILDDRTFWASAVFSAALAAWIVRAEGRFSPLSIAEVPPLALLVIILLRAKLPDGAYDSLFFKATIPITIADWRTALTGAFDHTLMGTDFLEIMVSQLRVLDPSYPPAMTSTLSFLALWAIVPIAARSTFTERLGSARDFASKAGALLLVSLTEPLMAAGTAYHEPMMALLATAFLLPMSSSWMFLSAGIATKITILFIAPVLIAMKMLAGLREQQQPPGKALTGRDPRATFAALRRSLWPHARPRPILLGVCLVVAAVTLGEQFYRNLAFTGRILGVEDMFVQVTDPKGEVLNDPLVLRYDIAGPHGPSEWLGKTFVHILTLDRWIKPTEFGFHVLPSSRFIAVAAVLCVLVLVVPSLRRNRHLLTVSCLYLVCTPTMLSLISQGRLLLPLSLGGGILIAYLAALVVREAVAAGRNAVAWTFAAAISFAAIGDQVVGSFINDGWECTRRIAGAVVPETVDRPESELERRLAEIVAKYRANAPGRGIPPSIVCENTTGRKRYVGTHHIYAYMSTKFSMRFVAANPVRAELLPTSVLAVCFTNPQFVEALLPPAQRKEFVEVPGAQKVRILVSNALMAGVPATSLPAAARPSWLPRAPGKRDLIPEWEFARLLDTTPADTPSGKGTFVSGGRTAVLLSPYRVAFADVEYRKGDKLTVELAMPYSNSDGMGVELVFESAAGARHTAMLAVPAKPPAATAPLWERKEVVLPAGFEGRGKLTLGAASPSGDSNADWVYVRRLSLDAATP